MPKQRIVSLDYLRGLAAFAIMFYHLTAWLFGLHSADSVLGRIGIYGVSIFYVLSGLTLFYVYGNRLKLNFEGITDYTIRRIFRIFPLLWLVTTATLIIHRDIPTISEAFLAYSGLFGFVRPKGYIAIGAWSIGNELVFYVIFLALLYALRRSRFLLALVSASIMAAGFYYANFFLISTQPLIEQWPKYINPLNQAFLFLSGFLLGALLPAPYKSVSKYSKWPWILMAISCTLLFTFWPSSSDAISIVTGWNRVILCSACIGLCAAIYQYPYHLPILHRPLLILGEMSYSVYLIHPLVYEVVKRLIGTSRPFLSISTTIIFSLVIAYFVYFLLETYFIKKGRNVAKAITNRARHA